MKKITDRDFFTRKSEEVAHDLLGKFICSRKGDMKKYQIILTEAYYYDEIDDNGKKICYGAGKTKQEAAKLVSAPLFEKPGTWCIYCGQLIISVTDDVNSDNVLIKEVKDEEGNIYTPHKMAMELRLYKKYGICNCHGKFSLSDDADLNLTNGVEVENIEECDRKGIKCGQKGGFKCG